MNVFLDSSALAKRYVEESGSERLEEILASASALALSVLAPVEIVSALCRRRREGTLTAAQYARAKEALFEDVTDASLLALSEEAAARAVHVLERWPLRASDALHVACAAEWRCDRFISADERQILAAGGIGLEVEQIG